MKAALDMSIPFEVVLLRRNRRGETKPAPRRRPLTGREQRLIQQGARKK